MRKTYVLGRDAWQSARRAGLAPMLQAIRASIGHAGRGTLYEAGATVKQALTGSEIARHCCYKAGKGGPAQVLLRETLVRADKDLGDGTARLAVMAGAALDAGERTLDAEIEPRALAARIAGLRSEIDAGFMSLTQWHVDVPALLASAGLPAYLISVLTEAVDAAGEDGQVEMTCGRGVGAVLGAHEGFVFDADPIEQTPLDALENVSLIVANDVISDFRALTPVIESFAQQRKALVIAAREVDGQARALLEQNRRLGALTVTALKPRDAGPRAASILEDLAAATGAHLVSEGTGLTLTALKPHMLGRAERYSRDGHRVRLTGAYGESKAIDMRLHEIQAEIRASQHLSFDLEHARRRYARMKRKWVELELNTGDETATNALIEKARRALKSLEYSRSGGVLPGAGLGLEQVAAALLATPTVDSSERAARAVVAAALRAPAFHIRRNIGQDSAEAGYNGVMSAGFGGLTDPTPLSRIVLDEALSFSMTLLGAELAVIRR